jgi:hypothetical protein
MDVIKATLRERQISPELVKKTKHYYHHYLTSCSNPVTEWRILAELCPPLRNEVLMFLNARAVMHIDFFRGQDTTFVASVCKLLKPCFAAPSDYVFREGELGLEMFFVQSGTVEILCAFEGGELRLDCQEQGSYFGEVAWRRCYPNPAPNLPLPTPLSWCPYSHPYSHPHSHPCPHPHPPKDSTDY